MHIAYQYFFFYWMIKAGLLFLKVSLILRAEAILTQYQKIMD